MATERDHRVRSIIRGMLDLDDVSPDGENIKISAKESLGVHEWKQHKPWFDEECLGFLDQRKQAKMQWVQDPSQSNVDNLNSVRYELAHISGTKRRHI